MGIASRGDKAFSCNMSNPTFRTNRLDVLHPRPEPLRRANSRLPIASVQYPVVSSCSRNEGTAGARQVTIHASVTGKFVEVAVVDNGSGLAGCDFSKIFDPFFTTKQNGMGMGLAISRTIVEAHGGKIWAVSVPEGGAAFRFTLPFAADGMEQCAGI